MGSIVVTHEIRFITSIIEPARSLVNNINFLDHLQKSLQYLAWCSIKTNLVIHKHDANGVCTYLWMWAEMVPS